MADVKNCSTCSKRSQNGGCVLITECVKISGRSSQRFTLWEQREQQPITNLQKFAENITDEQFAALVANVGWAQCEELCPAYKDCNPHDESGVEASCYTFAKQWANSEVTE